MEKLNSFLSTIRLSRKYSEEIIHDFEQYVETYKNGDIVNLIFTREPFPKAVQITEILVKYLITNKETKGLIRPDTKIQLLKNLDIPGKSLIEKGDIASVFYFAGQLGITCEALIEGIEDGSFFNWFKIE